MVSDTQDLDEVIVVAYGTAKNQHSQVQPQLSAQKN